MSQTGKSKMMSKDDKAGHNEPFPPSFRTTAELAEQGWFVEVILTSDSQNETVFLAVGVNAASDAEVAVLRYPGIQPRDGRIAKRKLSSDEIALEALARRGRLAGRFARFTSEA
jgi:hypothetical protein